MSRAYERIKAKTDEMDLEIKKLETRAEVLTKKLYDSYRNLGNSTYPRILPGMLSDSVTEMNNIQKNVILRLWGSKKHNEKTR